VSKKLYLQPTRHCPSCGKPVIRAAGLYRCKCGRSFDGDGDLPIASSLPHSYNRSSPDQNFAPIDGRAIPLTRRFK
jgi:ribosomal protein L37AE/L43A